MNYLRGAAWIATGALQIEGSKRATDLISEVSIESLYVCWETFLLFYSNFLYFVIRQKKYRQQAHAFKHTSVTDSPDIVHAKFSSKITNEVLNHLLT